MTAGIEKQKETDRLFSGKINKSGIQIQALEFLCFFIFKPLPASKFNTQNALCFLPCRPHILFQSCFLEKAEFTSALQPCYTSQTYPDLVLSSAPENVSRETFSG